MMLDFSVHRRIVLGRGMVAVREDDEGVEVEGVVRVAPGRPVELVVQAPVPRIRLAVVGGCRVVRFEAGQPVYRAWCRWAETRAGRVTHLH